MSTLPSFAEFESAEKALGATEVLTRTWNAGQVMEDHTHPFDARAVVIAGEMWLTVGGKTDHLRPGDRFDVPRGTKHAERYGPEGATYWVARRA